MRKKELMLVRVARQNQNGIKTAGGVATIKIKKETVKKNGVKRIGILVDDDIVMEGDYTGINYVDKEVFGKYWNEVSDSWESLIKISNIQEFKTPISLSGLQGGRKSRIQTVGYLKDDELSKFNELV